MTPFEGVESPREDAAAGHTEAAQGTAALAARLAALAPLLEQMLTTRDALLGALARDDRDAAIVLLDQIRTWRAAHDAIQSALGGVAQRHASASLSAEQARTLALIDTLTASMVDMEILLARRLAREERVHGRLPRLLGRVLAWWRRYHDKR
jgi:hypothetical protein